MKHRGGFASTPALVLVASSLVALTACSEDTSGKNWSALATCLAGPAANAPVVERVPKIRQMLLGSVAPAGAKDAWPARCATIADDLYVGLDKSGKTALLKRKLQHAARVEGIRPDALSFRSLDPCHLPDESDPAIGRHDGIGE